MSDSPAAILYSSDGYEVAVIPNTTVSNPVAILSAGSDGSNIRVVLTDSSSRQVVVGAGTAGIGSGGVFSIQGVGSGTPVPVSGTITANAGSGNFSVVQTTPSNLNALVAQGSPAALPSNAWYTKLTDGTNSPSLLNTTPTGSEYGVVVRTIPSGTQTVSGTITANAGAGTFSIAGTGTAGSPSSSVVTIQGIASGTAIPISGSVTASNASIGATGSTIPTSATFIGGLNSGNLVGVKVSATGVISIDGSASTQPVSGTVTANIGTPGSLALDATLTGGSLKSKITDGTNTSAVMNSSPVGTEYGLIVRNIPSGTQVVSGTVTAANASVSTTGSAIPSSVTAIGGTDGTNLRAMKVSSTGIVSVSIDGYSTTQTIVGTGTAGVPNAGVLTIQGITSGTPIPVSGTVTAANAAVGAVGVGTLPTSITYIGGKSANASTTSIGVTIKDQNVASVVLDSSLVVAMSPNSPLPTGTNSIGYVGGIATDGGIGGTSRPVIIGGSDLAGTARTVLTESGKATAVTIYPSRDRLTYSASNPGGTTTGTAATTTTSIAYLFHASASNRRIEIQKILVSYAGGTGGQTYTIRGDFITAENVSPGGTTQTASPHDRADTASAATFRINATGAPTRIGNDNIQIIVQSGSPGMIDLVQTSNGGKPIILKSSTNEGYEIRVVTGGTILTTAATICVTFFWAEGVF